MAHVRVVDFAESCGVSQQYIKVYAGRGKVVVEKSGLIDEDHPMNQAFKKSRKSKKKKQPKPEPPEPSQAEDSAPEAESPGFKRMNGDTAVGFHELEKRLKALDIQKRAEEVEKLRKQNAKLDGETIPTELAAQVVNQLSQAYVMSMKIMIDKTIGEWSKRKKFTGEEVAVMRRYMMDELNRSAADAIKESKKSMRMIVDKYSVKRGVGERA